MVSKVSSAPLTQVSLTPDYHPVQSKSALIRHKIKKGLSLISQLLRGDVPLSKITGSSKRVYNYLLSVSLRDTEVLQQLRAETAAHPMAGMIVPPEQGQFLAFLAQLVQAKKVLEVGVGGGYHTAILAELTPEVSSVEFHAQVAEAARRTLARLGYRRVKVNVADGYYGWRPGAPYDAILVRMAIPDVSSALIEQLKPGGRLIAPVGPATSPQQLILFQKGADGRLTETAIMEVIFRALPGGTRL